MRLGGELPNLLRQRLLCFCFQTVLDSLMAISEWVFSTNRVWFLWPTWDQAFVSSECSWDLWNMACVTQTLICTNIILFNMDFHGMGFKWDTQLSSLLTAGKRAWNYTLTGENSEATSVSSDSRESFELTESNSSVDSTLGHVWLQKHSSTNKCWGAAMFELLPGSFPCLNHSQVALSTKSPAGWSEGPSWHKRTGLPW